MNSSRNTPPPPDMGGLTGDWAKLQELRRDKTPTSREPQQEQHQDKEPEQPTGRRQSRPGRTRGGRKPPPAAADAIPTTVRFDPEESSQIDRFVLELRDDAGRRALDKAEVVRELIRMGMEHEPTRKALLRRLR
ncbi:hypothetical protein [Streptomyces sp. NPDC051657]|uniref:hypothetical protein n=1 Tax=unclassified Streptomyces TaxID=2593676 RepID=UPI00343F9A98